MKKLGLLFAIALVGITFSGCTFLLNKKANKEFSNLQFSRSITDYEKVLAKKDIHQSKINLANAYRFINNLAKAEPVYSTIVTYPEVQPIEYFNYAKILMYKGDYATAKTWFDKFLEKVPGDQSALMLKASCDSLAYFMRDTTLYTMSGVKMKDMATAFGCIPYKNGMVFTGEKEEAKKSKQNPWTGKSYLDLYYTEKDASGSWSAPQPLKGELNGAYHEGVSSFNKTGDVVYFTRSDYKGAKLNANEEDVNTLKLFKAKLVNGNWEQLEEIPLGGKEYSVGHPCISSDEKTLYFISNMSGGFGGTDIYKSTFDGTAWGKPENLGASINTTGNEMFPKMGADNILYFSSDAHTNMGGLDVFSSTFDPATGKWSEVENMRYPINSTKDDFSFDLLPDSKKGFVSSNRNGADMVYEFDKNDPKFNVSGIVTLIGSNTPLEGVNIDLLDLSNNKKAISFVTDNTGRYKFKLEPNTNYNIVCTKNNHFTKSAEVSTKKKKFSEDFVRNFETDIIEIEKPIVIENIYFDLDKWKIRKDAKVVLDTLVLLLNDNPTISIEMGSHCDSRASDEYNLKLSEKRAAEVVKYLIKQKIAKERLTSKGYGETMLVNGCTNDVKCSEEEHQKNRRTEFKVTKIEEAAKPAETK